MRLKPLSPSRLNWLMLCFLGTHGLLCQDSSAISPDVICELDSTSFQDWQPREEHAQHLCSPDSLSIIRGSPPPAASMQSGMINDEDLYDRQPEQGPSKRRKLSHPGSTYWDNLSRIWLTKSALRELDRRNSYLEQPRIHHKPVSQQSLRRRPGLQLAPDPLHDCSPECLKQIRKFSRRGGPDLSDLRSYPEPEGIREQQMTSSNSGSRGRKRRAGSPSSKSRNTRDTVNTTTSTPYSRNFQQNLIDHGVYPDGYEYPDGEIPAMPANWKEINERLVRPRPSLSPSRFSDGEFRKFKRADTHACKETPVTTAVIPFIEGDIGDPKCAGGGYVFRNLAPLTDGTLSQAKPDRLYGARPEQLDRQIRKELSDQIIPSTQDDLPMAPNFFLEAKGPDGSLAVATRQACYDGALGARGMHSLRSYRQGEPTYDNNAYTITSIYHGGQLKLYTTHLSGPRGPGCRPEYIMTQLNAWSMIGNAETFRQGASAYRNARDWAKEARDSIITIANERLPDAQSEDQTTSSAAVTSQDPDASTVPNETENQDAQWSFEAPSQGTEEDSQNPDTDTDRNPKKQRVGSIVSGGDDPGSNNATGLPN